MWFSIYMVNQMEQSVFGKHIWKGHSDSQPDAQDEK